MFKLNIECTKDINELHINFADGSSTVIETENKNEPCEQKLPADADDEQKSDVRSTSGVPNRTLLTDYIIEETEKMKTVIKPPTIPDINRPVKVSKESANINL